MKKLIRQILENGMIYRNNSFYWASAAFVASKPGPARWGFPSDLRPISRITIQHHYQMPNLEIEFKKLTRSEVNANF